MTQQDVVDLALEYGAKKPKWWPGQPRSPEYWQLRETAGGLYKAARRCHFVITRRMSCRIRTMEQMLAQNKTLDLSAHPRDGVYYRLACIHRNIEYCDAEIEKWIEAIGRRKRDGALLASLTTDLAQNADFERVWIR